MSLKKRLIFIILITFLLRNCIIINTAGAGDNRVKGDEVKKIIQKAAILSDLLFYDYYKLSISRDIEYISYTSIFGPILMNIKEDEYYYKSDVKECTKYMDNPLGVLLQSDISTVFMKPCIDLEPVDGHITGKPFPKN